MANFSCILRDYMCKNVSCFCKLCSPPLPIIYKWFSMGAQNMFFDAELLPSRTSFYKLFLRDVVEIEVWRLPYLRTVGFE